MKRSFSLLEVLIALMVASVAIVPFIKGPQNQLSEAHRAILYFERNLALDAALVEGLSSIVKSGVEFEKLEETPKFAETITIGTKNYKALIELNLHEQDEEIPPKAALVLLHITLNEDTHSDLDFPLCITRKK